MLLNYFKPYLTRACPEHVQDVVAESLVEWDGLKSRIYRRYMVRMLAKVPNLQERQAADSAK